MAKTNQLLPYQLLETFLNLMQKEPETKQNTF